MTSPLSSAGQYASVAPFLAGEDPNLAGSGEDSIRVRAYGTYEDFYHNRPETFKVMLRGDDDEEQHEVYIPSAKKCIEATNRFLGKEFDFAVSQRFGTEQEQTALERMLLNLFKRERMYVKFSNQKRYGLIRGDVCWHITADLTKEPSKRLSIHELNPANYFPIEDPDNPDRLLGCHIVDVVEDPEDPDKTIARRLTYLKKGVLPRGGDLVGYEMEEGNTQTGITSEITHWGLGKWDDRNLKQDELERRSAPGDRDLIELPDVITQLPVYHWRNNEIPGMRFGLSEIAGVETLIAAVNQAVNDEDLVLVMQGLGFYWTNARPPVNADGSPGDWRVGPAMVAEVPVDGKFERASGVSSVSPYQDHISMMKSDVMESLGIPDIAAGKVEVTVAESGVSLALQMLPIIAKNSEKEEQIIGIMDQMLYDIITMWFPAFEEFNPGAAMAAVVVGDPIPRNRDAAIQEVILLFTSGLITIAQAQAKLSELGYSFVNGDDKKVILEAHQRARAEMGELDNRYSQELEDNPDKLSPNAGNSSAPTMAGASTGVPTAIGANTGVGV